MRYRFLSLALVVVLIIAAGYLLRPRDAAKHLPSASNSKQTTGTTQKQTTPAPATKAPAEAEFSEPVAQFRARATKKQFGTYVTPSNSPVQPERFTGYHTGVDSEYADVTSDVPVHAMTAGTVIASGTVSGYGGVVVIRGTIRGAAHTMLYGHLAPSSLIANGTDVTKGQVIGHLGQAFSAETDGERRHLHFSITADGNLNYKGYVQTKGELSAWVDPLQYF